MKRQPSFTFTEIQLLLCNKHPSHCCRPSVTFRSSAGVLSGSFQQRPHSVSGGGDRHRPSCCQRGSAPAEDSDLTGDKGSSLGKLQSFQQIGRIIHICTKKGGTGGREGGTNFRRYLHDTEQCRPTGRGPECQAQSCTSSRRKGRKSPRPCVGSDLRHNAGP